MEEGKGPGYQYGLQFIRSIQPKLQGTRTGSINQGELRVLTMLGPAKGADPPDK